MSVKDRTIIRCAFIMLAFTLTCLPAINQSTALAQPLAGLPSPDNLTARAAIVIDYPEGHVLFDKASHLHMAPASTTKIVTALLALEYGELDDIITVAARDLMPGTSMGLKVGERISLRYLMYGMLLPSGNDAASAVARYIGSMSHIPVSKTIKDPVARFVALMNVRAAQLKLTDSHFANPHGLDAPNHYSSAYDLACFTYLALKFPLFAEIVHLDTFDVPGHPTLHNLNKMLKQYPGADGVKTGFTGKAGLCLVTSAHRGGKQLVSVVLNATKWVDDSTALLDYGFARLGVQALGSAVKEAKQQASATPVPSPAALSKVAAVPTIASFKKKYMVGYPI
jgi:D-alanyl-D-alanine carboxypeptidase (penicillin-binding protein 5/6)